MDKKQDSEKARQEDLLKQFNELQASVEKSKMAQKECKDMLEAHNREIELITDAFQGAEKALNQQLQDNYKNANKEDEMSNAAALVVDMNKYARRKSELQMELIEELFQETSKALNQQFFDKYKNPNNDEMSNNAVELLMGMRRPAWRITELEIKLIEELFQESIKDLNQHLQDRFKNMLFAGAKSFRSIKKCAQSRPKFQMELHGEDRKKLAEAIWKTVIEIMIIKKQNSVEVEDDDPMKDAHELCRLFEIWNQYFFWEEQNFEDKGAKRLKIHDWGISYASASGTKDLLDGLVTVCSNVKRLHRKMRKSINGGNEIEGLEARILALLQQGTAQVFKKYEMEGNKSFLGNEWDWETLNALNTRAVNQGIKLSHLLVDMVFLMAKDVKLVEKFALLGAALEWVSKGENSVVSKRIVKILDAADRLTRKKQKSTKGKAVMLAERKEEEEWYAEDISDTLILGLLEQILLLERFWVDLRLPSSKMSLKKPFQVLIANMENFEAAVKRIESKIPDLLAISELGLRAEDFMIMKESSEHKAMQLMINELWNKVQD